MPFILFFVACIIMLSAKRRRRQKGPANEFIESRTDWLFLLSILIYYFAATKSLHTELCKCLFRSSFAQLKNENWIKKCIKISFSRELPRQNLSYCQFSQIRVWHAFKKFTYIFFYSAWYTLWFFLSRTAVKINYIIKLAKFKWIRRIKETFFWWVVTYFLFALRKYACAISVVLSWKYVYWSSLQNSLFCYFNIIWPYSLLNE